MPFMITLLLGIFLFSANVAAQTRKEAKMIANGTQVSFEYTLSDEKGSVIESNRGKEPLTYIHGRGEIIPGLEKELLGMKVNDEKNIRVKADEAYGRIDPKAFREIPKSQIPPDALKVGATLVARTAEGQSIPVRIHEIKNDTVLLDFNHPLAGKNLTFDVKVLGIKSSEAK